MNTIVKNTVKVAAVAAGVWVVKKLELDKKLKEKLEKSKYAQVPINQNDTEIEYDDCGDYDDDDDYIVE